MKKRNLFIALASIGLLLTACNTPKKPDNPGGDTPVTPTEEKVSISFNANGGTGTMAAVEVVKGSQYTLPANAFTAPEGKEFAGWKVGGEGDLLQPGAKITADANKSLVAQWQDVVIPPQPVDATIKFFYDGAEKCLETNWLDGGFGNSQYFAEDFDVTKLTYTVDPANATFTESWTLKALDAPEEAEGSAITKPTNPLQPGIYTITIVVTGNEVANAGFRWAGFVIKAQPVEPIEHQAQFINQVENPSATRAFRDDFDQMIEDFSGATPSGTTTGHYNKSFLRVLVDSEDTAEPKSPDAAIYKMATGSYQIHAYEGIGFRMRMVGNSALKLSNLVLGLRGDDAFQVYPINLGEALNPDGEPLEELTNEFKDVVIAPGQSIEDANTVYQLAAGGDSAVKVLEQVLGFHLYALNEECSAVIEIEEVFLLNAGEKTVLDNFSRTNVGVADATCWWRGSTGFIVQKGVTLDKEQNYQTADVTLGDYKNLVITVMGDTSGLTINGKAYSALKDCENAALTGAVNGAFYSYVINLANSELTLQNGGFKFQSEHEVVIAEIFLTNLATEEAAKDYPLIDIAGASYVSNFNFTLAQGTIKTDYNDAILDTRVTDQGLNYIISYNQVAQIEVNGSELVFHGGDYDYANFVIGSNATVKPYLVFAVKQGSNLGGFRIKSGTNPEVFANQWLAAAGLPSVPTGKNPYVVGDYELIIIDLARSGFESWNNEVTMWYTGADDLVIDSIFFADVAPTHMAGNAITLYDPATNSDLTGYAYLGGFDCPTDATAMRIVLSSVSGTTLESIRFTANGEKWFKNNEVIGVDGEPISKDTVVPAGGQLAIDIDLEASGMSGAAGIHSGGYGGATGDITLVSAVRLVPVQRVAESSAVTLYDPATNSDLTGYAYLGGFDCPTDATMVRFVFSSVSGTTLESIRFTANGEKWFKNNEVIGVDGQPISKDTAIPAGGQLVIDVDLAASGMSGAVGIHSGGYGDATGDITLVSAVRLVSIYSVLLSAYNG